MARILSYFDGFNSRQYIKEWPQGDTGDVYPGGTEYPGTPIPYSFHVPNEGRFFGQAFNGSYDSYYGNWAYISPEPGSIANTFLYWQFGYWAKRNANLPTLWDSRMRPYHIQTGAYTGTRPRSITGWGGIADNGGTKYVRYYNGSSYVWSTDVAAVPEDLGVWYWIEQRLYLATTAVGIYELRINGQQISRMTNIITAQTIVSGGFNCLAFTFGNSTNSGDMRYDDIYLMVGTSEGDLYWPGKSVCEPIVPTGDGDSSDGSPSTGISHYAVVDAMPKDDSDYITMTAGNGKKELYSFSNIDTTRTRTVRGVKVVARARKTDAGVRKLRAICKVNGIVYNGDTYYVETGWREIYHIWELNPNTSSVWTASEVNGAQFGFEQVT